MGNNQRLKLEKDASKSILKEETNKKILKRRAYVYLWVLSDIFYLYRICYLLHHIAHIKYYNDISQHIF